jgi:D-alanine-D-alanine ligase
MGSIGVVFGGPSPEHDISILTGLQAARILRDRGHDTALVYWAKNGTWLRVPSDAEASAFLEPEIAGATPLDLTVPGGFRERRRLKAAPLDSDLAGIAAIPSVLVTDEITDFGFPPPWIVKPRFGGSSLGVEGGVGDLDTAKALARAGVSRAGAIAQPHLEGWTDLNIAVRTHPQLVASPIERPLHGGSGIYDYRGKYLTGSGGMESAPRELPAQIPDNIRTTIERAAIDVVRQVGLTGAPRVDFLWDGEDQVLLCEVNSIPGALGLYLWQSAGVAREAVIEDMIAEGTAAGSRPHQWSANSDGTALRVAGSVASKLA